MASVLENASIQDFQEFVNMVYVLPNDMDYELGEMLLNLQRSATRSIKGIRQGDSEKAKTNTLLSLSWFTSTMIRLHINVEEALWKRFPYLCSYCGKLPCSCKKEAVHKRRNVPVNDSKRPETIKEFQQMFNEIYPPSTRTLEIAGLHLAEELGELSQAIQVFRWGKSDSDFEIVAKEAADYLSTVFGVFNSLKADLGKELAKAFYDNCHACHKAPCECQYPFVKRFK